MEEGDGFPGQALPIFRQSPTMIEPSDGPFNDPTLGEEFEALRGIRSLDDSDLDISADVLQSFLDNRPLVAAISVRFEQKGVEPEQSGHEKDATVPILDVSSMDDGVHQHALHVDQDPTLFSLDFLAPVITVRIDRAPLFLRSSRSGNR